MADLLSRVRGKPFFLLILMTLFISSCNDNNNDDDDNIEVQEPVNAAPTISSADTDTASIGTLFTYTLTASDADGDAITFQASLLPTWLTFDAASGALTGTPTAGDTVDYQVTLGASDGLDSTPLFLTISLVNGAPTITSTANNNGVVGSAFSYTLTANDAEADTLVMSSVTLPSWATFDAAAGTLTGTPLMAGDYQIELSVTDSELSVNQKFTLVVTDVPSVVLGFDETVVFSDFGGAIADIITNPDQSGINTSDQVGRMQKFAGELFGGTTIPLDDPITLAAKLLFGQANSSFSLSGKSIAADNVFTLKVWSQRQVALTFKLEGDVDENDVERVVTHDGTGWEVLSFDFTGVTGAGYTAITLIFDNGVVGDAADDAANWTFYFDDMVIPVVADDGDTGGDTGGDTAGPEILINGGFESGYDSWNEIGTIEVEAGNSYLLADVQAAGNPWDVNLTQVITLMPDTDYILSFKAKASVARTMLAGLGQNFPDFVAVTETVALTTEWQTYTYTLTTTGFGGVDNRVLFDMGAEIGAVSLDDVSVTLASGDTGGDTGGGDTGGNIGAATIGIATGELTSNGDVENSNLDGWTTVTNGGIITVDDTQSSGSAYVAKMVTGNGNPSLALVGLAAGTVMPGDTVNVSFDMCGELVGVSGQFRPSLLSERGNDEGATLETLATFNPPDMPAVWTRYNYVANAGVNVTGGVTLQFDAVCGAVAGCGGDIYIDNVSLTIDGSVNTGTASGLSCVAGSDTGGDTGGSDAGGDTDTGTVTALAVELVVFENAALPEWAAWTDNGGPTEVLTDGDNGEVTKFTLTKASVAGFTSRDDGGAVNGMTFDASSLNNGMITFDFKMVKAPDAGLVDWKLKVESSTATNAEVNLSTNVEGHATPLLDTWQTYSFPIATLAAAGLDAANIDLFMVFPDYNSATGAEYYLDNFKITSGGAVPDSGGSSASMSGGSLIVDVTAGIDFEGTEAEQASWDVFENQSNPALEFVANPVLVGNNSSQVAKITLDTAPAGNGKFAGAVTRTVTTFKLSTDTVIAKIWVWKDKISPVGIKFERERGDGYGSHGELTVSNTKVNEWEQLTIDFTSQLGLPENDEISGIAIFPDMVDGRTGTVVYFDEITFTAN